MDFNKISFCIIIAMTCLSIFVEYACRTKPHSATDANTGNLSQKYLLTFIYVSSITLQGKKVNPKESEESSRKTSSL